MTFTSKLTGRFHFVRLIAVALLLSAGSTFAADNTSSIKMVNSSNFGIDDEEIASLRDRMEAAVEGGFVPGAILVVGNDEGIGVLETVGTQGPDDSTPMSTETLFRIFSMTKPVVSVATMSLVEDGLVALDDPVAKYIPEYASMGVLDEETGAIRPAENVMTVEHLLTHESGLIYGTFDPQSYLGQRYLQGGSTRSDITALELAKILGELPLRFEPGTAWHYSRSTDVLGAVLEVAAGQPLDELLKERIFDPLGMGDTSFYIAPSEADRIAEPAHGDMANNLEKRPMLSGGGGLNSTTEDYIRFANMLLNGGVYRGERIIGESTLDLMTSKYIGDSVSREYFFYGNRGDWGLGFNLQPTEPGNSDSPHNFGWFGIGGTDFIVDPANDFFMLYMVQFRNGPRGAPMDRAQAQAAVYEAMQD
ncbi:MAG: serine hydrolase domain-containing protein [Pseudohongiellaceae bacterium]